MTATIRVFDALAPLQQTLKEARLSGQVIGLVPTMGNLHEGHASLVREARKHCDFLLATIFVNPLQFGPGEDYERYPKSFDADVIALERAACDAVYVPSVKEMYPTGLKQQTLISVPGLSALHCGKSRPGHFDGVCTVVAKLFNMLQPDIAVFGLKDFQQFRIISKMVEDLQMPVKLLGLPTVREDSGLALSSRNGYLSKEEKNKAAKICALLQATAESIRSGKKDYKSLSSYALIELEKAGLKPDYFHICNLHSLEIAVEEDDKLIILVAAFSGDTRLIDNIQV